MVFLTIEDETGIANIVVWSKTMERFPEGGDGGTELVRDRGQDSGSLRGAMVHLVAERLPDRSQDLVALANDALVRKPMVPAGADDHRSSGLRARGRPACRRRNIAIRAMSASCPRHATSTDAQRGLCFGSVAA